MKIFYQFYALLVLVSFSCKKTPTQPEEGFLTAGLIAFYSFNANANDASGNGHHGSLNGGVTWVNDRFNISQRAAHFNGSDAYISIVDSTSVLNFDATSQSYSISSWAKLDSLPGNRDVDILIDRGTPRNEPCSYYMFYRGSTGRFVADAWDGYTNIIVPSATKPVVNTWYHLVMVADTQKVRLYVNGVRGLSTDGAANADSIPAYFTSTINNEMLRTIGDTAPDWITGHHYFTGVIDDVRIYNRALSDAEISSLYHEGGW